ncbi:MAG: DUF4350 domain-containing protein [Actinomycetes bacterium]
MTADLTSDMTAAVATPVGPEDSAGTPAADWRRRRRWQIVAVVVATLVVVLLLAWAASPHTDRPLDPESPAPSGARAVANVLRGQGVAVVRVTDDAQALSTPAGSTLVVAYPERLSAQQYDALAASPADVVLLGRPSRVAGTFVGIDVAGTVDVRARYPVCSLEAAVRAGQVDIGGAGFTLSLHDGQSGDLCYPEGDLSTLAQVRDSRHTVTVVGNPAFVTNDRLADRGNAALALDLIGTQPRVAWWLPSPRVGGRASLTSLLPRAIWLALAQVVVAVGLLAWWRGRRLGRVVVEPLPVAVHAAETTEGRADLYRRNRARDAAADHLRQAATTRLVRTLHLPSASSSDSIVAAAAGRTGRSAMAVRALLYGPTPNDDSALVDLARSLDALEKEVRPL